jgi:GNAT superfamily N-acetyltransferase
MTSVRPGSLDDAAAYLELRRACYPWQVNTVEGVAHYWRSLVDRPGGALFAVDGADGLAGFATCQLNTWTSEEGAAGFGVTVAEGQRRQGIGSALLAAVEEHLRASGGQRVRTWARDEEPTVEWARRRGYETSAELRFSRASLADLPPGPPVPPGVTTVSLEELGPEASYAVDVKSMMDEPGDQALDNVSYDEWVRDIWEDPIQCRDLGVAVLVDGVPAACTLVEGDRASGRLAAGGTGTLREYRGRGLAKLAKSVSLRRARDAGFVEAFASNDEVNAPMLAINTWLGYQAVGAERSCLKQL